MLFNLTLVVDEASTTAERLCALLNHDGMPARQVTPDRLLAGAGWSVADGIPELMLVSARMDIELVRRVVRRVMRATGRAPTVVSFSDTAVGDIEAHMRAGLDYIVPPFLPGLVGSRLVACHVRQALSRTAEGLQDDGDLTTYKRELRIGQEIQSGFLPEALPVRAGWQLAARFRPARVVAGDFYDAFELAGGARIGLVVGDVCDKGVGAALFMALVRSLLRHTATQLDGHDTTSAGSPGVLVLHSVVATNEYLIANHLRQGYFATLFFAVLDPLTGSLVYANCGHDPPVLRRANGVRRLLWPTGPALGLMPNSSFGIAQTRLAPGELLFAYTDGVPDAKDIDGRLLSRDVVHGLVAGHRSGTDELLDLVERTIHGHVGGAEQSDDIVMVALRRQPGDQAS